MRIRTPREAKQRRIRTGRASARRSTAPYRAWLIKELRADLQLAAEYLRAAAEDSDPRVRVAAMRTVAAALEGRGSS